jgi:uncharacterized protein (DUF2249 family)
MNQTSDTIDLTHFDVRRIPCRAKHAQIFQRWAELPVGGHFVLVNDHDPVPLYYQFEALFRGAFTWEYLVDGPTEFHVKITRLKSSPITTPPAPPRRPPSSAVASSDAANDLDLRGMEPPEPMLRILNTLETMPAGATFRARTDRQPIHLYSELATRGARHVCDNAPDGSWITTITRG